jgi:hypothetical protein
MSETPLVGGETLLPGEPVEDFAFERGSTPPNLFCSLLDLQMTERDGVDTFVRECFVSEAVPTGVRGIMSQGH